MKTLTDIAMRLRRHLGRSSLALLETLELAVMKRYRPEIAEELRKVKGRKEIETALNRRYHELGLRHRVTEHDETLALELLAAHLAEAPVDPEAVECFLQEFTIEKSGNDLYGFSTPTELKELMVALSGIKEGESLYNPCFGIGGLFGTVAQRVGRVEVYGEEIESINRLVAGLTAQLFGLESVRLRQADVLNDPAWCAEGECRKFDHVLCNPPLDLPLDPDALRGDPRFSKFGVPPANAPELAFLEHAAATMEKRAVVLVRRSVLQRSSVEAKIRTKMARDGLVEAVVALPRGVVPHWREEMALVVLSPGNQSVLFFDADIPYYSKRKGRRNTIHRVEELARRVLSQEEGENVVSVPLSELSPLSLAPAYYLKRYTSDSRGVKIGELTRRIFRAQRVHTDEGGAEYLEIGMGDIVRDGWTLDAGAPKRGDARKIERFRLKKGDILLPLRGGAAVVGIVGGGQTAMVPNAGILVVRPKEATDAVSLWLSLRSKKGRAVLQKAYDESPNRTVNAFSVGEVRVELPDRETAHERFEKIRTIRERIEGLEKEIERIVDG